ncbi:unnamed protein product [Rotaria sordida]|uniref:HTH La-type RNA-binding domain-containing protein n=1 Tax=Rotaria sordida TaxID=392033 RepID=A0A814M831_9BILA|nr:unnamed protein product [Rotaria sordida]
MIVHPSITNSFQVQQQFESTFTIINNRTNMFNITDQLSSVSDINYRTIPDHQLQLSPEQLREKLRKQLEYYFSRENMIHDSYLQSQMDADNYVPISLIANFKLVKRLTQDLQLIIDVLKESPSVEVDIEEKRVRSSDNPIYLPTRKRCIIILRNVPLDATENEILELFLNKSCPVSAIACERVLEFNHSDCWYVTFNSEDDAQNAFLYLTRESIFIRGQKILARMKACLWQKPVLSSNDNIKDSSIPKNSSLVSTQEQITPVYIQTLPTNHINQSSLVGNLSHQQTTFKPRHIQVLQQYLPMNYNSNILSHHPHNVPSTYLFTTNMQPLTMNYYSQTQFLNRNHSIFPINFWYKPPTADSYSPMFVRVNSLIRTYNIQSKSRVTTASKPRNTTKTTSNQIELSNTNNHPNALLNSSQNSTSHSEDTKSSISHNETLLNQSSIQTIQAYSSDKSTIDDYQKSNNEYHSSMQISNDNTCKLKSTEINNSLISQTIEQLPTTNDSIHQCD